MNYFGLDHSGRLAMEIVRVPFPDEVHGARFRQREPIFVAYGFTCFELPNNLLRFFDNDMAKMDVIKLVERTDWAVSALVKRESEYTWLRTPHTDDDHREIVILLAIAFVGETYLDYERVIEEFDDEVDEYVVERCKTSYINPVMSNLFLFEDQAELDDE